MTAGTCPPLRALPLLGLCGEWIHRAACIALRAERTHCAHTEIADHAEPHKARCNAVLVACCRAYRVRCCTCDTAGAQVRITHDRAVLQIFDALLIAFVRLDARHTEGDNLDAAFFAPLGRQLNGECVTYLLRIVDELRVADTLRCDASECGLQCRQQLAAQLLVDLAAHIVAVHVAADIGIEENRIRDTVAVRAETADVHVERIGAEHRLKLDRLCRAVLIADDLLRIDIVDALILRRIAAERKTSADIAQHRLQIAREIAAEHRRLGRGIVRVCARLRADLHDLALIDDHHALTDIHHNDRARRDDIALTARVRAAPARTRALLALCDQRVGIEAVTAVELLPLVGENPAHRAGSCLNQSHRFSSLGSVTQYENHFNISTGKGD